MTAAEQELLFTEYHDKVFGYIRSRVNSREDAEDLCQDVFLKAFRASDGFDPSKASRGTWVYSITRNTVIDFYRRSRTADELPEELADDSSPDEGLLREELLDELASALEELPTELCDLLVLRYYDRLQLTEIAAKLKVSYGVVKIRHKKALSMLKVLLEKKKAIV